MSAYDLQKRLVRLSGSMMQPPEEIQHSGFNKLDRSHLKDIEIANLSSFVILLGMENYVVNLKL